MKANYKDKIEKDNSTSEIILGNLYDINKQIMDKEPELSTEETTKIKEELCSWFLEKINQKYFMILCHEERDYTLFNLDGLRIGSTDKEKCIIAAEDVIDCMKNRGILLSVCKQDDGAYEIWIKKTEGCCAYYLFPYGAAVLEY